MMRTTLRTIATAVAATMVTTVPAFITGARWGLSGAEAVLRLRSLRASGDFDEYWSYHEKMEQERNHSSKYENGLPGLRDNTSEGARAKNKGKLRLVKG